MLRPKAAITLEEDESSARVSDEDSSTDSITDAFDFVPNRAKLAFCKVDETMQQVPPLLAKASNGRPGIAQENLYKKTWNNFWEWWFLICLITKSLN